MANKKEKLRLASITILVKGRRENSAGVNRVLTKNGHFVVARLGVNVERRCVSDCLALIAVAVEGTAREIAAFAKELNKLKGVSAKTSIM